jgi:hypothetical protein
MALAALIAAGVLAVSGMAWAASCTGGGSNCPGDPTGDGRINAGDITQVELCILYPGTYPKSNFTGWDANEDALGPNAGDVQTIEYMIIGSWPLNHIHIEAPDELTYCTNFTALLHTTRLDDFSSGTCEVVYNASVLEVTGVTNGSMVERLANGTAVFYTVNVTDWSLPSGQGMVRINSSVDGGQGVTGSGYLSEIHFHVNSSTPCDTSGITFNTSECVLYDDGTPTPAEINATWAGDSLHVAPVPTPTPSPSPSPSATPTASPSPSPTPTATPTATPEVTVWIDAPGEVSENGSFIAYVNVSEVDKLSAADYDVVYDPDVLELTDVPYAGGVIGGSAFPVDMWGLVNGSQGAVRIIQSAPGMGTSVSGSGYMAEVHFDVIGSSCDSSDIEPMPGPFDGGLFDSQTKLIPCNWISDSMHVSN